MTTPAHGSGDPRRDGAVIYSRRLSFTGNDSFTYTMSDGLLTADRHGRVTVARRRDGPSTATAVGQVRRRVSVLEDSGCRRDHGRVTTNDGDPDLGER